MESLATTIKDGFKVKISCVSGSVAKIVANLNIADFLWWNEYCLQNHLHAL